MGVDRTRAVGFGIGVHAARFGLIWGASVLAPLIGITGWWIGLFVNALCVIFAIVLVSVLRLWRSSGFLTPWRGWIALLFLLPMIAEATVRFLPSGLDDQAPGYGFWALSLLCVGFNEELVSRVVVLSRMRTSFSTYPAVAITAGLFGVQHLSAFATTSRGTEDILLNVVASACYGFVLVAYQYRFAWIWPLILVHATADFTTILTRFDDRGDLLAVITSVLFVLWGFIILKTRGPAAALAQAPLAR